MDFALVGFIQCQSYSLYHGVKERLRQWVRPDSDSLAIGTALDLTRSKSELVLENALLRQQLAELDVDEGVGLDRGHASIDGVVGHDAKHGLARSGGAEETGRAVALESLPEARALEAKVARRT